MDAKSIDLDAIRREARQFADLQTGPGDAVRAWQFRQLVDTTTLPAAALALADEVARLRVGLSQALASVDGVDLQEGHVRDNTDPDQLRVMLLGAGLEIARLRAALQAVVIG